MVISRLEVERRARLSETRAADAKHEALMQSAAKRAGANLKAIRSMKMESKDKAMLKMFAAAGEP